MKNNTTNTIRIPKFFYEDHVDRDCPAPAILRETKTHYFVDAADHEGLDDLLHDAEHYASHPDYAFTCGIGLVSSARATAKAICTHFGI